MYDFAVGIVGCEQVDCLVLVLGADGLDGFANGLRVCGDRDAYDEV